MAQLGGEIFLSDFQYIGFKRESDRGVLATLTGSNYNILAMGVTVTTDIKENQLKFAVGHSDAFQSVMGAQAAKVTMKIPMKGSGSASVAPVITEVARCAGFQYSATSSNFVLLKKIPGETATIQFDAKEDVATSPTGKRWILRGCAAEAFTMHVDTSGALWMIECTFIGAISSIADIANGSLITPDITTESTLPPAALSMTANYRSVALPIDAFTLDCANKTTLIPYVQGASGYAYAAVTDHDCVVNIAPRIQKEATQAYAADLLTASPTLGELDLYVGSSTNSMQIVAPKCQIVKGLNWGSKNGIAVDSVILRITQNSAVATNPLFAIFFPKS